MRAEERKREKYLPTLLIQQIRLQWYKDCRGGNAAAQRNQYPRAMRLPKDFFSYYSFGLPTHFASIVQRPDGFRIDRDCRRLMEWKPNGTMRLHPFELIQQESGIQVRYRYDWHIDWDTGIWYYVLDILNVMPLAEPTDALTSFTDREPNKIYTQIDRLW